MKFEKKKRTIGYHLGQIMAPNPHEPLEPRKPTDLCLLCRVNAATQRNSHLIPKFLTNAFFEDARESARHAEKQGIKPKFKQAILNNSSVSSPVLGRRPLTPVASTGKEDYILCPSCERKISLVETEIATFFFNRFRKPAYKEDFPLLINYGSNRGDNYMTLNKVHPTVLTLFVYSMYWRVSISSLASHSEDMDLGTEEVLRVILNEHLGEIAEIEARGLIEMPFAFFVQAREENQVALSMKFRKIYQFFDHDINILHIDGLSFTMSHHIRSDTKFSNNGFNPCQVKICCPETWIELINAIMRLGQERDIKQLQLRQRDLGF
jgi:hypothetical protein